MDWRHQYFGPGDSERRNFQTRDTSDARRLRSVMTL